MGLVNLIFVVFRLNKEFKTLDKPLCLGSKVGLTRYLESVNREYITNLQAF